MRLLELPVECPKCGAPPPFRTTPQQSVLHRTLPPDEVVSTWRCTYEVAPRRRCNSVYLITASDFVNARMKRRA